MVGYIILSIKISMQVIVISLKKSAERRKQAESTLNNTGLKWSFLDAIDGATLDKKNNAHVSLKTKQLCGYELSAGEVGCFLSHKRAWEQCIKYNQVTLILEDDFKLTSTFNEIIDILTNHLTSWELLRLQGLYETNHLTLATYDGVSLNKNIGDSVGATAYLIKPSAAKRLLECSNNIYEPLDHYLEHSKKHGLNFLATNPYPVTTSKTISTISDRPERYPIKGVKKYIRSMYRLVDRHFSNEPWFPK